MRILPLLSNLLMLLFASKRVYDIERLVPGYYIEGFTQAFVLLFFIVVYCLPNLLYLGYSFYKKSFREEKFYFFFNSIFFLGILFFYRNWNDIHQSLYVRIFECVYFVVILILICSKKIRIFDSSHFHQKISSPKELWLSSSKILGVFFIFWIVLVNLLESYFHLILGYGTILAICYLVLVFLNGLMFFYKKQYFFILLPGILSVIIFYVLFYETDFPSILYYLLPPFFNLLIGIYHYRKIISEK
jgi:hypothetical protein